MCARPADPQAREALLDAARAEFAHSGLERARIEDIARRAGLSKGAFYLHFASKEAALGAVLQRFLAAMARQTEERKRAKSELLRTIGHVTAADFVRSSPRLQRLLAVEHVYDQQLLEILWRNRSIMRVLCEAEATVHRHAIIRFRRGMLAYATDNTLARQASGLLRKDIDPQALADLVVGAYEAFARRMMTMRRKPDFAAWSATVNKVVYEGALEPRLVAGRARGAAKSELRSAEHRSPAAHNARGMKRGVR